MVSASWADPGYTWSDSRVFWDETNQRDEILNLLQSSYAVSASQTLIAQWNHNRYNKPIIYGHYLSTLINESNAVGMVPALGSYVTSSTVYSTTLSNQSFVTTASVMTSFNTQSMFDNTIRIMFEARISNKSDTLIENVSDFLLKITPYYSTTQELTRFIDMKPISIIDEDFTKYEIIFCSDAYDDIKFNKIALSLKPIQTLSGGTVTVEMKNISISPISIEETEELQIDRLKYVFNPNRPGDQILENNLISSSINPVSKYYLISDKLDDTNLYPELIPNLINPFNENIYFMAPHSYKVLDVISKEYYSGQNIFFEYASAVKTNQIYIKTQNFDSSYVDEKTITPLKSVDVYISTDGSWSTTPNYSGSISQTGCIALQYNGSTALWTEGIDNSSLPQIDSSSGTISSTNFVNIKGIHVIFKLKYSSEYIRSGYLNRSLRLLLSDIERLRVVEISPRLSIDLSNFLISTSQEVGLDGGDSIVPVGKIAVGTGNIKLENLPRVNSSGSYFQIFDNNQFSPLNNLIKSDTKFTIYTSIIDNVNNLEYKVKSATMYSDEWTFDGIETVSISVNDYSKYLQAMPAPDLLLINNYQPKRSGTVQKSLEALFQLGGFSDYDIPSLNTISERVKSKDRGIVPIFYSSKEKKIYDILSETLLGYQMSAYFDSNGVLQFRDILRETGSYGSYSNSSSYFKISNISTDTLANIISITTEKIKSVGELTVTYKQMSVSNNIYDGNGNIFDAEKMKIESKYFKKESNSSTPPYSPDSNAALICVNVIGNVSASDTKILVGDYNHTDKREPRFITDYKGYGVLEGEIISWDGLSYAFSQVDGFPIIETIRSKDDLTDAISQRLNAMRTKKIITSMQNSSTQGYFNASFSTPHKLAVNQNVFISINSANERLSISGNVKVTGVTNASVATFKDIPTWNTINLIYKKTKFSMSSSYSSYAGTTGLDINYFMTGSLCNVRRGLFGTYATDHRSENVYDESAFITFAAAKDTAPRASVPLGITLQSSKEADNATNFNIAISPNSVTYLGFNGRDNVAYKEFTYSFTPANNLDSFGIFFSSSITTSGGGTRATMVPSTGVFIEFFSPSYTNAPAGALVRIGTNRNSDALWKSDDKFLNDTWKKSEWITVTLKNKSGSVVKDEHDQPKTEKKWVVYPPKQNNIIVKFDSKNNMTITVNGKVMKFYPTVKNKTAKNKDKSKVLTIPGLNKNKTTFGIFAANAQDAKSSINIQGIYAGPQFSKLSEIPTWLDINNRFSTSIDINEYILYSNTSISQKSNGAGRKKVVRPFYLRATPFIRGIEINDVKWSGDVPYYDLYTQEIEGMLNQQVIPPGSIEKSTVVGTPFRGRYAYKNKMNEVVYTKASSDTYIDGKVYGKTIDIQADRKVTATLDETLSTQKLEISLPWSAGESTAQQVANTILKMANKMDTVYKVEIFGNPALQVGDHVKLTYTEKNIYDKILVIISINTEFSDGGISTSLTLRDVNWS